ncbi:hypothetical protein ROHU_037302 [Labeo rohita]|uniref:Uncharacterized protein n=1 Tax=Labeo rohita TaxID=84645 RepID=A0A498LT81_LABRO|nr:hypothetical protein ROHU_037302 [Labeo rohita]
MQTEQQKQRTAFLSLCLQNFKAKETEIIEGQVDQGQSDVQCQAYTNKKNKIKKMFLIMEFEGEGTTGPVAKTWYADGYSWWPPYKDLDKLLKSVRTMETPQPEKGWTRHRARILHESVSFQNVANNWKKASYTSDINSELEIDGKRIPTKKTSTDHIYESDDEAAEQPPLKKRKAANKACVPPAPKPPAIPKRNKKAFVNQQQRDMEDQQQNWCESFPSFQAPVGISQVDHHRDGWSAPLPDTQAPVGISQVDNHGDGWSAHPTNTQEPTFTVLRPSGDHQGRTLSKSTKDLE